MRIEHLMVRDAGTAAKRRPSTTSGITSGYQRTNVTTSGVAVIESTEGCLFVEVVGFPWPELASFSEPLIEGQFDLLEVGKDELAARGYKALSKENQNLAEELFAVDAEMWSEWKDK